MILPITESILRGELRPNLTTEAVSPEKLSLWMRQLRYTPERSNLIELEKDLINTLGDVTNIKETYTKDKELRNAISNLNRPATLVSYTRACKSVLSDILTCPEILTPTSKMYKTILRLEKQRTIWAVVELHSVMKDDRFIRSEIKSLLGGIKTYSKEVKFWKTSTDIARLLQNMLTELYFSLILTFSSILYRGDLLDFDDDFEDFVYQWNSSFPTKEEKEKYLEEKKKIQKENAIILNKNNQTAWEENEIQEKEKLPLDKAERFLEDTKQYTFLEMPKIRKLAPENAVLRKQKALQLIKCMLENPAHAVAMLDYLGFYKWIKDTHENRYTLDAYDHFCTKVIIGKDGKAFKNYRLALKYDNINYRKYNSWKYLEQVENEYQACYTSEPNQS